MPVMTSSWGMHVFGVGLAKTVRIAAATISALPFGTPAPARRA
jgi:hypothetical protein